MLTIRLQRTGKRNQADFRIVLAEKAASAKKKFQEILGSYNPRKKYFKINEERLKYWILQRVQLSPTMHNLLVSKSLLDEKKVQAFKIKKKPASAKAAEDKKVIEDNKEAAPALQPEAAAPDKSEDEKVGESKPATPNPPAA